jgi:2-desacetyl-2-hydroxyethyl bacteriochlorophyllide A dehydrogenase
VTNVKAGDRCAVEPYLNCQKCYACRRGFTNCCEHNQTLGVMCDGGLTERIVLPARKFHVANRLGIEQCALVETLAIGCHAIDRGAAKAGETVLIIGAGPIGLSAVEFAKLSGARVVVMDIAESRLAFVREKMGVPDTLLAQGDDTDFARLREMTAGQMADVVVDATGNNRSMVRALEFAAFAGRVVYVGITQQNLEFPHAPVMHRRELTLMASRNALSRDFTRIIRLIEEGQIDTGPWITHHAKFADVPEAFPAWLKPENGVIKAVIDCE